jgi:hypothetical protein
MNGFRIGDTVVFKNLDNARGYKATGTIVDLDDEYAIVNAYGLAGPGSQTHVNEVPLTELKRADDSVNEMTNKREMP